MSRKNNAIPEEQQAKLIEIVNRRLADFSKHARYASAQASELRGIDKWLWFVETSQQGDS